MNIDKFLEQHEGELKEYKNLSTTELLNILLERNQIREAIQLVKEGE